MVVTAVKTHMTCPFIASNIAMANPADTTMKNELMMLLADTTRERLSLGANACMVAYSGTLYSPTPMLIKMNKPNTAKLLTWLKNTATVC